MRCSLCAATAGCRYINFVLLSHCSPGCFNNFMLRVRHLVIWSLDYYASISHRIPLPLPLLALTHLHITHFPLTDAENTWRAGCQTISIAGAPVLLRLSPRCSSIVIMILQSGRLLFCILGTWIINCCLCFVYADTGTDELSIIPDTTHTSACVAYVQFCPRKGIGILKRRPDLYVLI